jgi:hypothetical protein
MLIVENRDIRITYSTGEKINWKEVIDAEASMNDLKDGSYLNSSKYIVHEDGKCLYTYVYGPTTSVNCGPYNRLCFFTEATNTDIKELLG